MYQLHDAGSDHGNTHTVCYGHDNRQRHPGGKSAGGLSLRSVDNRHGVPEFVLRRHGRKERRGSGIRAGGQSQRRDIYEDTDLLLLQY